MNKASILTLPGVIAALLYFYGAAIEAQEAPFVPRPLSDFQMMLERPLFTANRRPLEEEVADPGESDPDEKQIREVWRLTGIVLEPQRQLALFSQRNGSVHERLEVGMTLASGWELAAITADYAELQHGERSIKLLLFDPNDLPAESPDQSNSSAKQRSVTRQKKATAVSPVESGDGANGAAQPAPSLKRE